MSKKKAVIGLGNTLRKDDGIGIFVLESLANSYKREGIDYLNFGIAGFSLLHRIKDYDIVLLIDGINAGLPLGELKIFELDKIEYDFKGSISSSHEIDLRAVIEFFRKMGVHTKIYVAGIQVADVSYGEGLTGGLRNKKEDIVKEVGAFVDDRLLKEF